MRRLTDILTARGRAFVTAGTVLLVCGLLLGVTDLTRIGALGIVLPLLSSAVARRHPVDLEVERQVSPARLAIDEPSNVELALRNVGTRTSPTIMGEEHVDHALGDRPRFVLPPLAPGDRRVVRYTIRSHVRGRHRIGPVGIRVRDAFGLTTRKAYHTRSADVLVLPRVTPLAAATHRGSELGADGTIPHVVALHGEGDVSIREYRDGDDLRRIHWPATARTGGLMVRQEDRPATRRATVLLDSRASAHRGSGPSDSFEWAVGAAASVATHLLGLGYSVHLLTRPVDDREAPVEVEDEAALDVLAELTPGIDEDFALLLHCAASVAGEGGLVVAILAPMEDLVTRAVAGLRQPGSNGLAFVLDVDGETEDARPRGDATLARRTSTVLEDAGWSVLTVVPGMSVADAWHGVAGIERLAGVP